MRESVIRSVYHTLAKSKRDKCHDTDLSLLLQKKQIILNANSTAVQVPEKNRKKMLF